MEPVAMYAESRRRLVELAAAADVPVPALPGWTVQSTYAHLTGLCDDVLAGRMTGAGTPAWTAAQLAAREGRSVEEICEEWMSLAPSFDAWVTETGDRAMFCVFDVWTHHQDVRGAVGLQGQRDELVGELLGRAVPVFDGRFQAAGVPALRLGAHQLGAGTPEAALDADEYALMRMLFGRRSRAQIEAMDWDGSPEPFIDHLHLFELPVADLVD